MKKIIGFIILLLSVFFYSPPARAQVVTHDLMTDSVHSVTIVAAKDFDYVTSFLWLAGKTSGDGCNKYGCGELSVTTQTGLPDYTPNLIGELKFNIRIYPDTAVAGTSSAYPDGFPDGYDHWIPTDKNVIGFDLENIGTFTMPLANLAQYICGDFPDDTVGYTCRTTGTQSLLPVSFSTTDSYLWTGPTGPVTWGTIKQQYASAKIVRIFVRIMDDESNILFDDLSIKGMYTDPSGSRYVRTDLWSVSDDPPVTPEPTAIPTPLPTEIPTPTPTPTSQPHTPRVCRNERVISFLSRFGRIFYIVRQVCNL